ncbi:ABC transporter ATP-binding protein [Occultella aeris]|uniref:HMP/thiamine import ATP-binding protein YkoD n=1 Tax=Occultella aeris TaxID=2761496 RepID=A0A7M4DII3_9MICO|nr:ABC transporter ATP-binding protein [Occultella aeris]VZO36756.1 Putative HMP/thiamine import ATP-binding protein YkoD [Occultella aeris]
MTAAPASAADRRTPPEPSAAVTVRDLRVHYPTASAPSLAGMDLDVPAGQRLLLMGSSGSGKSTVLRVLAGVVPGTIDADVTGRVRIAGTDPTTTRVPVLAGRVGTLTQDPADQLCLPTVVDEVAFACENRAVPPAQIGPRVRAALAAVGATDLIGRRTGELSGGQGQRVALAAALVARPEVLLLDEPTALLDTAAARRIGALLAAPGPAQILIEHRLDELGRLPELVVVLDDAGRVRAAGPTTQVLREHGVALAGAGAWLPAGIEVGLALGREVAPGRAALRAGLVELMSRRRSVRRSASAPRSSAPSAPRSSAPSATMSSARAGGVVLRARGLGMRRGATQVLTDVDLDVTRGRITAVVGVNGCGKSSLLLALAGLLPFTGTIDGPPAGLVFQNPEHQFLARSVRAEVAHGVRPSGWSGPPGSAGPAPTLANAAGAIDHTAAVDAVLARYHLGVVADRDPFRLSGGQQRRLSLAAMAVCEDEVFLADEPTFGQDRVTTAAVARALRGLADEGRGVVLVSHDLRLVATLADEVVVLADGGVLARGGVDDVFTGPALERAGLALPPLLEGWRSSGVPLRHLLETLDDALSPGSGAAA